MPNDNYIENLLAKYSRNKKGPEVLEHLPGGLEIISDDSIPQSLLIETLCDADLVNVNPKLKEIGEVIPISKFTGEGS